MARTSGQLSDMSGILAIPGSSGDGPLGSMLPREWVGGIECVGMGCVGMLPCEWVGGIECVLQLILYEYYLVEVLRDGPCLFTDNLKWLLVYPELVVPQPWLQTRGALCVLAYPCYSYSEI